MNCVGVLKSSSPASRDVSKRASNTRAVSKHMSQLCHVLFVMHPVTAINTLIASFFTGKLALEQLAYASFLTVFIITNQSIRDMSIGDYTKEAAQASKLQNVFSP